MSFVLSAPDIAVLASLAIGSVSLGYFLGRRHAVYLVAASSDTHESLEGSEDNLASVKVRSLEESKLALVVRTDLKMSTGKVAAQCSHATLACYKGLAISNPRLLKHWERSGQPKVTLKCGSDAEMDELLRHAQSLNLCARTIRDAGRTQIAAGSRTVLGVGPGPARLVNQVTGMLKLL